MDTRYEINRIKVEDSMLTELGLIRGVNGLLPKLVDKNGDTIIVYVNEYNDKSEKRKSSDLSGGIEFPISKILSIEHAEKHCTCVEGHKITVIDRDGIISELVGDFVGVRTIEDKPDVFNIIEPETIAISDTEGNDDPNYLFSNFIDRKREDNQISFNI